MSGFDGSFGMEYGVSENNYGGENAMGGGYIEGSGGGDLKEKKTRDKSTLMPVSIKQINSISSDSGNDNLKIDDIDVHQVRIIGTIEKKIEHPTRINYSINDGSGTIEVQKYINSDKTEADEAKLSSCIENTLVKVHGNLRSNMNGSGYNINAFEIVPITDWDEMTCHHMEIIATHLRNTIGPIPGSAGANAINKLSMGSAMGNAQMNMGSMIPNQGQNLNAAMSSASISYTEIVMDAYKQGDSNIGCNWDQALSIIKSKGTNMSLDQLKKTVTDLAEQGLMFSTTDEDNYAVC